MPERETLPLDDLGASDEELVRKAQAGSAESFGALYRRYLPLVYRFIYARVRDARVAEDLAASVFARAWKAIKEQAVGEISFRPWIYRIARNAVIDHYRTCRAHVALDASEGSNWVGTASQEEEGIEAARLWAALETLDEEAQTVLILRFFLDCTHAEVSAVLGKSEGACRMMQLRALRALAAALGEEARK